MSFVLSGLSDYTKENFKPLITASIFGAKMMRYATIMENVKGPEKLPILAQTVQFQTANCGFNATGSTTITQREITVGKVKINDEWCPKDFEPYFLRAGISMGSMKETIEPEEIFKVMLTQITDKVKAAIDVAIWQGRITASGGGVGSTVPMGFGNNGFWDGLRFQIQDSIGGANYVDANTASIYDASPLTAFNVSTMNEACMRIYMALANNGYDQADETIVYMGYDKYTALVAALMAGGATYGAIINSGFNGNPDPRADGLTIPGTNIKVLPVPGLNNINAIYGLKKSNTFIAVDSPNDVDQFDVWFSKDDRKVKMALEFKVGTQVGLVSEVAAIVL